jgi:hypothetical protein
MFNFFHCHRVTTQLQLNKYYYYYNIADIILLAVFLSAVKSNRFFFVPINRMAYTISHVTGKSSEHKPCRTVLWYLGFVEADKHTLLNMVVHQYCYLHFRWIVRAQFQADCFQSFIRFKRSHHHFKAAPDWLFASGRLEPPRSLNSAWPFLELYNSWSPTVPLSKELKNFYIF